MPLTRIGSPISPFVRKLHVLLLEKGIDLDVAPVVEAIGKRWVELD